MSTIKGSMIVQVYDITGRSWTYRDASVSLTDTSLIVYAENRMVVFLLRNIVWYTTSDSGREDTSWTAK